MIPLFCFSFASEGRRQISLESAIEGPEGRPRGGSDSGALCSPKTPAYDDFISKLAAAAHSPGISRQGKGASYVIRRLLFFLLSYIHTFISTSLPFAALSLLLILLHMSFADGTSSPTSPRMLVPSGPECLQWSIGTLRRDRSISSLPRSK